MSIFSTIRSHAVLATTVTVLIVVVAVLAGRSGSSKPATEAKPQNQKVTVVNAATFRNGSAQVTANGTVQSRSQADLKSQTSAPIASINVSIGDPVTAGQIILELQNTDIQAQLQSAQASLVLAQGQYGSSRQSAIDKIRDAYNKADSAVHSTLDPLITNNTGGTPPLFAYYMTDPSLGIKIRGERADLETVFPKWKDTIDALSATSSDSAIYSGIVLTQTNLGITNNLVNDVSTSLSSALRVALSGDIATITALQASVNAARDSINTALTNLTSAQTTLSTNGNSSAATAQVAVAQANVNNLQAQLDKTIIRSPISGKISALPLRVGELASPGTLLSTVVGDTKNLQVKAFVSADDLSRLKVGQSALIGTNVKGVVSNVAPSVDATTKKAEVDIDVTNSAGLIVGQNATISITTGTSTANAGAPATYTVPIQDVKIIPGSAFVLTVDQNSKIVFNPVMLGNIQGDFIQVTSGLSDDMNIVTPVYELDEGETVTVQ